MSKELDMEIAHIICNEYMLSKERQEYLCCFTKNQIDELIRIYDMPCYPKDFIERLKDSKPIGERQLYPIYITQSVMQMLLKHFVLKK